MPVAERSEYLEIFDSMDLESHAQRRIAVYSLIEYFKATLTDFGRNKLDLSEIHGGTSSKQWGNVVSRLAALDGFGDKEKRGELVYKTKDMRDDVAHNTLVNPSKDKLEDIREKAEDWEKWLSEWVDKYADRKSDVTPQELMQDMMENMVKEIGSMRINHYEDEKEKLDEDTEKLKQKIEDLEDEEEFGLKHIDLFKRVQELHARAIKLEEKEIEYEVHMEDMADHMRHGGI